VSSIIISLPIKTEWRADSRLMSEWDRVAVGNTGGGSIPLCHPLRGHIYWGLNWPQINILQSYRTPGVADTSQNWTLAAREGPNPHKNLSYRRTSRLAPGTPNGEFNSNSASQRRHNRLPHLGRIVCSRRGENSFRHCLASLSHRRCLPSLYYPSPAPTPKTNVSPTPNHSAGNIAFRGPNTHFLSSVCWILHRFNLVICKNHFCL